MVMGELSDGLRAEIVERVFGAVWLSLHTTDPGLTGIAELSAATTGNYQRKAASFDAATGANTTAGMFDNLQPRATRPGGVPSQTVTHIGVWSAPTGGRFLVGGPLEMAPLTIIPGTSVELLPGNVRVGGPAERVGTSR